MAISCNRAKGIPQELWHASRARRCCGRICGSSVPCSGSSGKIHSSLPRLPIMSDRTGFWGVTRYPKARWFGSLRLATETSIRSTSLSATIRGNGTRCCSNAGKRSFRYCMYHKWTDKMTARCAMAHLLLMFITKTIYLFEKCHCRIIKFFTCNNISFFFH